MLWGMPYALLAVLGVLPLILYLHSLRPGGRKRRTTALFIWERVLAERSVVMRLGWFVRNNLLLVLQLIAALLLIAALADPVLSSFGPRVGDTVVVVDLTASMKARLGTGTRFDAARREFDALVDGLPEGHRMMVIGAGVEPRLVVPYTADRERLRRAARDLLPTDAPGDVKEAIVLAHSFVRKAKHDRIVVLTDGAFSGAEEFGGESARLRVIEIAGGTQNLAIVGLGLRRRADESGRYEIMAKVRNHGARAAQSVLTFSQDDAQLARSELVIDAGAERVIVLPFDGDPAGTLSARIDIDDDLGTDNRAVLTTSPEAPVRLLYVGPGNPALNRLLRVFPRVRMTAIPEWDGEALPPGLERPGAYDAIVFDRVPVPELSEGNVILINTVAPNLSLTVHGESSAPRVLTPLARHPMTTGLELGELRIGSALRVTSDGDGVVLARGSGGPLVAAWERPGLRAVFIAFDLADSDLPYRVAFPVLFHNAFEWFRPGRREFPADAVRAGAPMPIFVAPGDEEVSITTPSGRQAQLSVNANPVIFADTSEAGIYAYKSAGRAGRFAVNLLDDEESDIRSRIGDASFAAARAADEEAGEGFPLWPILLAAGILLLVGELILARRTRPSLGAVLLRVGAVTTLVVACANPRNFRAVEALDVVVSVDVSRSVGQEGTDAGGRLVEAASRLTDADRRTGLLAFARTPEWEFPPRSEQRPAAFAARLDGDSTDIEAALQAALAQIGEGRQGRVLLVSDGNENRGEAARVIPVLRAQGVEVWTLPVSLAGARNEILVRELALPQEVDQSEAFELFGRIESLRDASARVTLLRAGVPIEQRDLALKAGSNELAFSDSLDRHGNHGYELFVEAANDTFAENNALKAVIRVKGAPRVLLVSSQPPGQRFLARALRAQGFTVVESVPETGALTLPELSGYELVVLENVPAFRLTHAKMENLATYVRDLGGGLLVIGGSRSYGAGGYYRTPLERILPVDMRPPARLELPHVALLFVIDKSGSMGFGAQGDTKLGLAKSAAVAATDVMNPTDQIGILSFDARWHWTLPFRPVGKGEWVNDSLSTLDADGGTKLYDAMVEARRAILEKKAAVKHVIVLSDGLSEKGDFQLLAADLAQAGVTLSTVSVGNDADVTLLSELARVGRGRSYLAVDPQLIPQIFTAETLLVSRDLLVERPIAPVIAQTGGALRGIDEHALPPLRGYVVTYPKPRAELLMTVEEDPLLVSWRHGLGRVMAFTSDLSGRWGREWVTWQDLPQWAGQLARATMRRIAETRTRVAFHADGDAVRVVADLVDRDGRFLNRLNLRSKVTGPSGETRQHAMPQSAPGRYEGKFATAQRGIHFVTLYTEDGNGELPASLISVPYVASYPGEYRALQPNTELLARLARETGGEVLDQNDLTAGLERLYTPAPGMAFRGSDSWWILAILGLLLFLLDLVLRSVRPLIWPARSPAG